MSRARRPQALASPDTPGGEEVALAEERHLQVLLRNADAAKERGDLPGAEYFTRRAVAVSSYHETKAHLYLRCGQLAEQQREFAEAVQSYGQGIVLEPRNPWVTYFLNNNMGYALCMLGRYEAAEPYCRTAIEVDRKRYNAHKNLGLALRGRGRILAGARSLASAAILWPHDGRALRHLGELIEADGGASDWDAQTVVMVEEARRIAPEKVDYSGGRGNSTVMVHHGRPLVLVIVDDEQCLRDVLSAEFRGDGFVAFGYDDKRRFLEELNTFPVDLILTDLNSPGMRGMELLRALKADARWKNIPVIIMSGNMTLKNALEAKRLGAADCIAKPYDYCDLLARVQEVLGR